MKKKSGWMTGIFLLALLLCACGRNAPSPVSEVQEPAALQAETAVLSPRQGYAARRCGEILSLYRDLYLSAEKTAAENRMHDPIISPETMAAIEAVLLENGCDVLVSNSPYPGYLATADRFRGFLEAMTDREPARQEVISVTETGSLIYWLFTCDPAAGITWVDCMTAGPDPSMDTGYEYYQLLDWHLTDRENFYFRIRPAGDKHYEDYTLIRLSPPDRALYDWNRQCILPVGYRATNIFLTDWSESDWGTLSFNDLWEYVYYMAHGTLCPCDPAAYDPQSDQYRIPAAEFEGLILPYFQMDPDTLRNLAHYQPEGDCYLWRPLEADDTRFLWFPVCTPEVTACRDNQDGTFTLTVEALSTDLKTDCLFAHEVTLRPLTEGGFQYVANRVTFQGEYGLPFCQPRRTWD